MNQSRQQASTADAQRSARAEADDTSAKPDGRLNRSVVTRRKIVDALSALVYEGQLTPTAEQVAVRAKVGLRTVFRHFDDMDALYREISVNIDAVVQPLIRVRLDASSWQERVLQSIGVRSDIYERTAAMHLAAQVHRHESGYLAAHLMDSAKMQRDLLLRLLPEDVASNAACLNALDLLLSFEAWIRLRREQGLTASAAREVLQQAVRAILAALPLPS